MHKLYCYVDETGQDTQGKIFIVSVVVTGQERDELLHLCEQIEQISGKRKDKWGEAKHDRRLRYLRHVFVDDKFTGRLRYSLFRQTADYDECTIEAITKAVSWGSVQKRYKSLVYVDGLSKTKRREYAVGLRRLGLRVGRVRGISRDESNALTRLADALAGFVRDALESGPGEVKELFESAKRDKALVEV